MRNLKRLLTLVMAVAMMMSMVVFSASAATIEFPDADDIVHTDAVNMAVALNIIEGRDTGAFDPKDDVKRGEMAKMITIILAGGNQPTVPTTTGGTYTDIANHWARDYIEYCSTYSAQNYDSGIINGYPDGTFRPDATVTGTEAAKMLLVAMGYNADAAGFTGPSWAMNINVQANSRGLYEDVTMTDPNTNLTRDDAAQMIWNALNATMVQYDISPTSDGQGGITVAYIQKNYEDRNGEPYTMLREFYKAETTYESTLTKYEWNVREGKFLYTMDKDDDNGNYLYYSDVDYSHLFGLNVKVVYKTQNNETTVLGMYAYKSSVLASGIIDDLEASTNREIKLDGDKYGLSDVKVVGLDDLPMYAQNQYDNETTYEKFMKADEDKNGEAQGIVDAYEVRLIDKSGDGKVNYAVYLPFSYGEVNTVNSTKITVKDIGGWAIESGKSSLSLDIADNMIYDDPESGDYVKLVDSQFTAYDKHVVTIMDNFDGTVTGLRNDNIDIMIDGTWYSDGNLKNRVDVSIDGEYTFYAIGSFIYYVDEISVPDIDNVVYLANYQEPYKNEYNVRLYFADGSSNTYSLKEIKVNYDGDSVASKQKTFKPADIANHEADGLVINGVPRDLFDAKEFFEFFQGHVFTYTVKGGEYTLTEIGPANRMGFTAVYDINGRAADAKTNNNFTGATSSREARMNSSAGVLHFADDALVFVKSDDGIDVITGAKAKNLKNDMTVTDLFGLYNTSGNTRNLKVASLITEELKLPGSFGVSGNYGYVVETYSGRSTSGDDATIIRAYNPDEDAVIDYADLDESGNIKRHQVIAFDDLGDKDIENVYIFDGEGKNSSQKPYDDDTYSFWGAANSSGAKFVEFYDIDGDLHYISITSDTKFITADTNATKTGTTEKSVNSNNSIDDADKDTEDDANDKIFNGLIPNIMVVAEEDNKGEWEAVLIVIDDSNEYTKIVNKDETVKFKD